MAMSCLARTLVLCLAFWLSGLNTVLALVAIRGLQSRLYMIHVFISFRLSLSDKYMRGSGLVWLSLGSLVWCNGP